MEEEDDDDAAAGVVCVGVVGVAAFGDGVVVSRALCAGEVEEDAAAAAATDAAAKVGRRCSTGNSIKPCNSSENFSN